MGMCQRHPAILLKKVKCHHTRWASGLGVGGLFRINFLVYSSVLFCSGLFSPPCNYCDSVFAIPVIMGCCCCVCTKPLDDILNDATISLKTEVSDIVIFHRHYGSEAIGPCIKGAMYVQDGSLHYRTACGRNLCCKCCSSRYDLAEIKSVEVVQNQSMGGHNLHIPIGLKITMRDGTLIVVAMKDATEFAPQLMKSCNLLTEDF